MKSKLFIVILIISLISIVELRAGEFSEEITNLEALESFYFDTNHVFLEQLKEYGSTYVPESEFLSLKENSPIAALNLQANKETILKYFELTSSSSNRFAYYCLIYFLLEEEASNYITPIINLYNESTDEVLKNRVISTIEVVMDYKDDESELTIQEEMNAELEALLKERGYLE